jgi:outer membrane protein TolC
MPRLTPAPIALVAAVVASLLLLPAGCKGPVEQHESADKVAGKILEQKQQDALGRQEEFVLESPADTLRRRLLLDQNLPVSHPASYGAAYINRIKHYPPDAPGGQALPATTAPATQPEAVTAVDPATSQPVTIEPLRLNLLDTLQIAAHSSREYQSQKEQVYLAALALDLERDEFRSTFSGLVNADIISDLGNDPDVTGVTGGMELGLSQKFTSGLAISTRIGLDLVQLLTGDRESASGVFADISASMPLLRGAGAHIVAEPLTQAERDVIYAIWAFENYKRDFAIQVAEQYYAVLEQLDSVRNAESNYRRLIDSTKRTQALSDAGRIVPVQVDQSINQELSARERWILSQESYGRRLDQLKTTLGLPPDAQVSLDRDELKRVSDRVGLVLQEFGSRPMTTTMPTTAPVEARLLGGPSAAAGMQPLGIDESASIAMALENRLDLRTAKGEVYDAQRQVTVAADALRTGLTLTGDVAAGSGRRSLGAALADNGQLRFDEGLYSVGAQADLPLERTAERNRYRQSLIALDRAVRALQDLEDQVKLDVRNTLRDLAIARESVQTQAQAVFVSDRRRASATALFEAGRQGVQVRDVLEAEDALIQAQNRFTGALIDFRLAELRFQRDLGVLEVDSSGRWQEYASSKQARPAVSEEGKAAFAKTLEQAEPATQEETRP